MAIGRQVPNYVFIVIVLFICLSLLITFIYVRHNGYFKDSNITSEIGVKGRNLVRNASLYVHPSKDTSLTHADPDICSNKLLVMIIVCSDTMNFKLRKAIRETWANNVEHFNMRVLFLVGYNNDEDINAKISEESVQYKDMITENFIDTYNNLTLKSIFMLKWMKNNCMQTRLLMKTDDDAYINITNLHKFVSIIDDDELPTLLICHVEKKNNLFRSPSSKWYMPTYEYPHEMYPKYCQGAAYLMSTHVAERLYDESLRNEFIHWEDVYITGICAKQINVTPTNHPLFNFTKESGLLRKCSRKWRHLIVLCHYSWVNVTYEIYNQSKQCW